MEEFIKTSLTVMLLVMMFDFAAYLFWGLSGQMPSDTFFFGSISLHIIQFIF